MFKRIILTLFISGVVVLTLILLTKEASKTEEINIVPKNQNQNESNILKERGKKEFESNSSFAKIKEGETKNDTKDWITYLNKRYSYSILYPRGDVNSLNRSLSPDISNEISIDIDPGKFGMRICAEDNLRSISSKDLLELWTNITPPDYPPSLCATFHKNVLSISETKVSGLLGYKAKIFSYDHNELCYFFATGRILLAVCIPEEDPADSTWRERLKLYDEVLSTLRILE